MCVCNEYVSGYVCVCMCVCMCVWGVSMSDSVSAGVCHFQMNPRQTGSTCI